MKLNKFPSKEHPRYRCNLHFDEFGFVLDDQQYSSFLALTEAFSLFVRSQAVSTFKIRFRQTANGF
jgi:hypothetical protein